MKLFKRISGNKFVLNESTDPIYLDRHGSLPSRPKGARFKTPDDYNQHMGFDAAIPDDVIISPEQIKGVRSLLRKGYVVTGHAKWVDDDKKIEILLKKTKRGRTVPAEVWPDGTVNLASDF